MLDVLMAVVLAGGLILAWVPIHRLQKSLETQSLHRKERNL